MTEQEKEPSVAFVVGAFPVASEAFILNQVADLIDRGVNVRIFTLKHGSLENISDRYHSYNMGSIISSLAMPQNYFERLYHAVPKIMHVLRVQPSALFRMFNFFRYGRNALSLKMLFWAEPFLGTSFDIVHCHFGPIAMKYLMIKDILDLRQKIVVTFYGYDVSQIVKQKGDKCYARLVKEASLVFVMSENMKSRVLPLGFAPEKIVLLPVSIDVASHPFSVRTKPDDGVVKVMSAGRFVEKKGFDDLIRALALVRKKTRTPFLCHIVGAGVEEKKLHDLAKELSVSDVIEWHAFMKEQDLVHFYLDKQLFIQTSKIASNGDME